MSNPVHGFDYVVDFTDQSNPDIDLREGDLEWRVESKLISNDNPANIGDLTTSTDSEHYKVKIAKANGDPGAANVGSAVLDPPGDYASWIPPGSVISGNLTGNLTVVKTSGGTGGVIEGLTIQGNVGSGSTITVAVLKGLTINGSVGGIISNTAVLDGDLYVDGPFTSTGRLDLSTINKGLVSLNMAQTGTFEGDVNFFNDMATVLRIAGVVSSATTIDFHDHDIVGIIYPGYRSSAHLVNGGTILENAHVYMNHAIMQEPQAFDGDASFRSCRRWRANDRQWRRPKRLNYY